MNTTKIECKRHIDDCPQITDLEIMLYLSMSGTLSENIVRVYPRDTEQSIAEYSFDITCTHCREAHGSPVFINAYEKHEMAGSRGEASFTMKCKFCGNEMSINLSHFEEALWNSEAESYDSGPITTSRKKHGIKNVSGNAGLLWQLDCRGCDISKFNPQNITFVVELQQGKMECIIEEGEDEWYDYDDNQGEEVSITEIKFDIIKGK